MKHKLIKLNKIRLDDISISYYIKKATEKEEKTIIFLHGFPFNKNTWRPQLESITGNVTAIAIDIRGHGLSTAGHGFFSIDQFTKDLHKFIVELAISNVVLCGVSMGGYIALRYYEFFPKDIIGLILSDTHHLADDNLGKKRRFDSIEAILSQGKRAFVFGFVQNLLASKTISKNPKVVELIKSSIRRNASPNICATLLALASRTDSSHVLSQITVPTLIIRGEHDNITPKEVVEKLHEGIKNSSYIEISNSGHLPNLENPFAFNKEMNDFLKDI